MGNGAWSTRVLGAVGAPFLAFLGVQAMRRPDPFSLLPSLPTAKLSIVFPNPQWVEIGTACMLLGCVLAFVWLPPRGFIAVPSDSDAIGTPPDLAVDRTIHAGMAPWRGFAAFQPGGSMACVTPYWF